MHQQRGQDLSTVLTDAASKASQFLAYLPFGEQWFEQQRVSFTTEYKFSGKELDAETGYNYFGARYYDSGLSVWLSVDPLADEYAMFSPYSFSINNPIVFTDPNGQWVVNISSTTTDEGTKVYSLSFVAQKNDNIESLSKQLGIPVEELSRLNELQGTSIVEGSAFGLSELSIVDNINSYMNGEDNSDVANCRHFAMSVNDIPSDEKFSTNATFLSQLSNTPIESSAIGDIVTYAKSFEEFDFMFRGDGIIQGMSDDEFKDYYQQHVANKPAHFAIVLLKTADRSGIQSTIEKPGMGKVSISTYFGMPSYEDGRGGNYMFVPSPANAKDTSPIYTPRK